MLIQQILILGARLSDLLWIARRYSYIIMATQFNTEPKQVLMSHAGTHRDLLQKNR